MIKDKIEDPSAIRELSQIFFDSLYDFPAWFDPFHEAGITYDAAFIDLDM